MRVSESSVKRWCDRGLIPSSKTVGGHRRISLESLSHFLRINNRTLTAPEKLGIQGPPAAQAAEASELESTEELVKSFTDALLAGDESACRQIIHRAFNVNRSIIEVAGGIVCSSMKLMGTLWENGGTDVLQERYGCEICFRLVNELAQYIPLPAPNAPLAIGCAPEGDQYQLPTHLVELVLREVGWNARSLGNNLPMDSLLDAVSQYRPPLVWISISSIDHREAFVERFNHFAGRLPKGTCLVAGGRAMDDALRPRLRYTAHCDNFYQLADLASAILKRDNV